MWYYAYCLFPAFRLFPVYQLPLSRPGCFSNGAPLVVILDIRFIPRRIILIFEFYQNFYQKLARHVRSKAPQKIKNQRSPFPRLDKKSPSPRGGRKRLSHLKNGLHPPPTQPPISVSLPPINPSRVVIGFSPSLGSYVPRQTFPAIWPNRVPFVRRLSARHPSTDVAFSLPSPLLAPILDKRPFCPPDCSLLVARKSSRKLCLSLSRFVNGLSIAV